MKTIRRFLAAALLLSSAFAGPLRAGDVPKERSFQAPHDMKFSVEMIAPVAATADLQIICVFKHNPAGDKYIEAMQDFNDRLGHLVASVRERGEFVGELGETFLFTPPAGSIAPKKVLLIGLGEEKALSLDTLRIVGRVALREAVRARAVHVAFAPTIRDQGNNTIDVGDGDRAVAENVVSAYDTEKRLQEQGLAENFSIADWMIEAGPTFFDGAAAKVEAGIQSASAALGTRIVTPYMQGTK